MHAGLLLVDKPAGPTSHDVVGRIRRAARSRRVGHAGTLDPFATGLLVVAVGHATRLLPYVAGEPKVYEARIRFGVETDTDDSTGTAIRHATLPEAACLLEPLHPARIAAESTLTGTIAQVPPSYSAKHVDGVRAYDLARKGRDVTLPPVTIMVHKWEWLGANAECLDVRITCGGGTYIRALARDLGRALGSAAHCEALRRVRSGAADVGNAVSFERLEPGSVAEGVVSLHSPVDFLDSSFARVELDAAGLTMLGFGRAIPTAEHGVNAPTHAVLLHEGQVMAIAERLGTDRWQPRVVLPLERAGT
ncbi:MAG: tRNA pseudouridine(55) synthase TruB [Gemmatimonadaceae bacterium]|nr:tRNA pseudouridine(55) synthase TruB [Gemmatimonadaceae bacterium]